MTGTTTFTFALLGALLAAVAGLPAESQLTSVLDHDLELDLQKSADNSTGIDHLIVGGREAAQNQFPSIVHINMGCGGTIIDRNWILTAAHCLVGSRVQSTSVLAGTNDNRNGGTRIAAAEFRIHSGYRSSSGSVQHPHDIALIRLQRSLPLSNTIRTAPLQRSPTRGGERVVAAGWGSTQSGGSGVRQLRFTELSMVSNDECNRNYGRTTISSDQICASAPGRDTCQGDSGGPLYLNGYVAGVVSWGAGCAQPGYPGVYASVPAHVQWIRQQTGLNI